LVDEVAVVLELDGEADWLKVAVAVTFFPFRPRGSMPLVRVNFPVRV
jgi:hypothetical protein